jgi:hypothetical protein
MQAFFVAQAENSIPQRKCSSIGPGRTIKSNKSIALQLIGCIWEEAERFGMEIGLG